MKYTHYYPNGTKRKFKSYILAIEHAFKQLKNHQMIEVRPPHVSHAAEPFGLWHNGSIYVYSCCGKNYIKC